MALIINDIIPNNQDWNWTFEAKDNGELIDFTGAYIEVAIADADYCQKIEATTDNGKITITGTGYFEVSIPESETRDLCAGTYNIGGLYELNDQIINLFDGTISVSRGVARR